MSFWSSLTGEDASETANAAAADQYSRQIGASNATRQAGTDYQTGIQGVSQAYDPYVQGGQSALQRIMQGLGLSGNQQAFTDAYRATPGYQSGLQTGTKAVTSRLNAGPGVQSGAAMKALQRYGSDYEDQRSGNYLQQLMGINNQGYGATQAQTGLQAQGYGGQLQANMAGAAQQYGAAPTLGQGMVAGANAEAAGSQNLLNTGLKIGGMALGAAGGMPSFGGSSFGGLSSNPGGYQSSLNAPAYANPYGGSWYG
jgi:hypothetical protein